MTALDFERYLEAKIKLDETVRNFTGSGKLGMQLNYFRTDETSNMEIFLLVFYPVDTQKELYSMVDNQVMSILKSLGMDRAIPAQAGEHKLYFIYFPCDTVSKL